MFRTARRSADSSVARFSALSIAAVLVLGGCTGSGDDSGADAAEGGTSAAVSGGSASDRMTESATASPAPTPSPTADAYKPASEDGPAENVPLPVMPELAKEKSKEGLEAFAGYWFSLVNYGYETGDTSRVQELSGPECALCESFYTAMEGGHAGDDWVVGGTLTVRALGSDFIETPDGRFQVILSIQGTNSVNRGPGGVVYNENVASRYPFGQIMEATYTDGRWIVDRVEGL